MDYDLFKIWLCKNFLHYHTEKLLEKLPKDYIESRIPQIRMIDKNRFHNYEIIQTLPKERIELWTERIWMLLSDEFLKILDTFEAYKLTKRCIFDLIQRYEIQELDRLYAELKVYFPDIPNNYGSLTKRSN